MKKLILFILLLFIGCRTVYIRQDVFVLSYLRDDFQVSTEILVKRWKLPFPYIESREWCKDDYCGYKDIGLNLSLQMMEAIPIRRDIEKLLYSLKTNYKSSKLPDLQP